MSDGLPANKIYKSPFRFSRVWEDHRLVSAALDIQPEEDIVLCITSAGDNVLNLLLDEPKSIGDPLNPFISQLANSILLAINNEDDSLKFAVAVDINPAESALLELKIAAIKHLSYDDYLLVLGDKEDTMQIREVVFKQIKEYLPNYAQEYFGDEIIKKGISTSGWFQHDTIEHLNDCFSDCIEQSKLDKFFELSTIEEQRIHFQKISSNLEDAVLSCLTREHLLATGWTEKQLTDIETIHGDASQYFLKHFRRVCLTLPVKDNFYLSLFIRGNRGFSPDKNPELAPPFLQRKNFHRLKQLVDRVVVFTGDVQCYLTQQDAPISSKVFLSNIFERLELDLTQSILEAVVDHMPSGGRLAYCTLLEPNKSPSKATLEKLTYLEEFSTELQKRDRVVLYSGFHVFSVKQSALQ